MTRAVDSHAADRLGELYGILERSEANVEKIRATNVRKGGAPLYPGAAKRFACLYVEKLPLLAQRQDGIADQVDDLYMVAIRLGMYDAADWMRGYMEAERG